MLRRLTLSITCLILLSFTFMVPVSAQDTGQETGLDLEEPKTVIRDSEGIKLQLVKQVQHPSTKDVYFDLVIYSLIDSDRVQVTWTVSGSSEFVSNPVSVLAMRKNTVYEQQAIIRPREFGVSTITVRVEAFEAAGTFVSTATTTIGSTEDGTVFPSSGQYQIANLLIIVRYVVVTILVFYTLGLIGVFAYTRYQIFIKKDERKF